MTIVNVLDFFRIEMRLKKWANIALASWGLLVMASVLEPMIHTLRHMCPVRPDGVSEASAIPPFARKYGVSCSACHVPSFPKLNDYGNTFRDHGYQMGTDQDLPTSKDLSPAYWPVAMRTTVGYQYSDLHLDHNRRNTGSFGFTGLDILSFGLIARDISYGVVYTPGLASSGFNIGNSAADGDLEAAFVRLDNLNRNIKFLHLDTHPYLVNFKIGKFEPDIPFSEHRSPTLNTPYVMYHYQTGTPYETILNGLPNKQGYSNPNDYALGDNQSGAELSGIVPTGKGNFRYAAEAFSNSNANAGNTGGGRHTNFYGHVTQSFKGDGVVEGHRVGVFGAYGEIPTAAHPVCTVAPCPGSGEMGRPFSRIGADLSLTFAGAFNLFGAVMHAVDNRDLFLLQQTPALTPAPIAKAQSAVWNGGFVQLDWAPSLLPLIESPGWLLSYRYDLIRNQRQADPTLAGNFNNVDSHTWLARWAFHQSERNAMSWHTEYNLLRTKGVGLSGWDQVAQTLMTGLDFAF